MKLIVGLGNPGKEYKKTRHNAGFITVDKIVSCFDFPSFSFEKKFNAEISEGMVNDEKIILAKPQTFMNDSGKAVGEIMGYYKIGAENVTVIHDDLDIPLGEYKISKNKNSGGHKGVWSIIDILGTKDFTRIRIGIKQIQNSKFSAFCGSTKGGKIQNSKEFVLEKFEKEEMEIVEKVIEEIIGKIVTLLNC